VRRPLSSPDWAEPDPVGCRRLPEGSDVLRTGLDMALPTSAQARCRSMARASRETVTSNSKRENVNAMDDDGLEEEAGGGLLGIFSWFSCSTCSSHEKEMLVRCADDQI
jgi:hypothetical protein